VEQRPALLDLSVDETLRRPFTYRSATGPFPRQRAIEWMQFLGLEMSWEQSARSLSVGQQQRLCLIRALLLTPSVLLLDEPTSALDATAVRQVEEMISERCDHDGLSVLIVTHQEEQAQRWCHRRVLLRPNTEN
jgi:putative ABC transport system ATP-binding protein